MTAARERTYDLVTWRRAGMSSRELTFSSKVVLHVLHEHMDWHGPEAGGNCWPALATIQAEAGTASRDTIVRALDELDRVGLILRKPGTGRGHSTRYFATRPLNGPLAGLFAAATRDDDPHEKGSDSEVKGPVPSDKGSENRTGPSSSNQGPPAHQAARPFGNAQGEPPSGQDQDQDLASNKSVYDVECADQLEALDDPDPLKLGRTLGALELQGEPVDETTVLELARAHFPFGGDDERAIWAGYRQARRRAS